MPNTIKVTGLREFKAGLRELDSKAPRGLRLAGNKAADVIVAAAKPRVPVRTGRAAGSIRAASTQTGARVSGGSSAVPYYGWLDFGGRVGRKRSVHRTFLKTGRYIWRAFADHRNEVQDILQRELTKLAEENGWRVS